MSGRSVPAERLYVGNLPYDVTEREIDDLFYKFGRIRDIEVKRCRMQDTSFAFVVFDDKYSVDDAIERRDGMRYGDMCLRVERGGDRRGGRGGRNGGGYGPPRRSAFRVRVYGLPPTASWQDLKDHMRKAGDVGFANVENRVGVVEYPTREEMEYAIKRLDGSEFCNIFHRSQIRVERDYDYDEDDGYQRRSGSSPRWRDRSRSPRREALPDEHQPSTRRSNGRSRSPAMPAQAHSAAERSSSVHKEQGDKLDAGNLRETRTPSCSASRSVSQPNGGCMKSEEQPPLSAKQFRRSESRGRSKSPSCSSRPVNAERRSRSQSASPAQCPRKAPNDS